MAAGGKRKGKMKSSPKAKIIAGGSGVIYSNPSNDPALKAVYDKLKKNPKALDSSGMGDHYNWKGKKV